MGWNHPLWRRTFITVFIDYFKTVHFSSFAPSMHIRNTNLCFNLSFISCHYMPHNLLNPGSPTILENFSSTAKEKLQYTLKVNGLLGKRIAWRWWFTTTTTNLATKWRWKFTKQLRSIERCDYRLIMLQTARLHSDLPLFQSI